MSNAALPLRAVFMGTPQFAASILETVLGDDSVNVVATYCRPDRPAGRGKVLQMPVVKALAMERGIPVEQPVSFKAQDTVDQLAKYCPDVLLVAAYGMILPQVVLDIPRLLPINVHASLLPLYRGAAPIQRAIMDGRNVTGITIMRMEAGLDTGPVLLQRAVGIGINDSSADLHDELAVEGGVLLLEALKKLRDGSLAEISQQSALATYAPKLTKQESLIDLQLPQLELHAKIRGLTPWPGATLLLSRKDSEPVTILIQPGKFPLPEAIQTYMRELPEAAVGAIGGVLGDALLVRCGDGWYPISVLRPAGKKSMSGQAFFNGYIHGDQQAIFVKPSPL